MSKSEYAAKERILASMRTNGADPAAYTSSASDVRQTMERAPPRPLCDLVNHVQNLTSRLDALVERLDKRVRDLGQGPEVGDESPRLSSLHNLGEYVVRQEHIVERLHEILSFLGN